MTSLAVCAHCGRRLHIQTPKNYPTYYRGDSYLRGYYDCPYSGQSIHADRLDEQVAALIQSLKLLNHIPESAIERAVIILLNLHDSWEWATREERKMLVRTMIQEAGCDVGAKRIVWVKVNPDYEILFRALLDRTL